MQCFAEHPPKPGYAYSPVEHDFRRQALKPTFDSYEFVMNGGQVVSRDGAGFHAAYDAGKPAADAASQDADVAAADFDGGGFDLGREICGFHSPHDTAN